jgi:hypothetical protein
MKSRVGDRSARTNRALLRWLDEIAGEDAPALLRAMQRRGDIRFSLDANGDLMLRLALS